MNISNHSNKWAALSLVGVLSVALSGALGCGGDDEASSDSSSDAGSQTPASGEAASSPNAPITGGGPGDRLTRLGVNRGNASSNNPLAQGGGSNNNPLMQGGGYADNPNGNNTANTNPLSGGGGASSGNPLSSPSNQGAANTNTRWNNNPPAGSNDNPLAQGGNGQPSPPRYNNTSPRGASAPAANAPIAFRLHQLKEASTNTVAYTVLVPKGWNVEGGTQRTPPQLGTMFSLTELRVAAPDGREMIFYPTLIFIYSDMPRMMGQQVQALQPYDGGLFLPPPDSIGSWILQMAQLDPDPAVTKLKLVSEEMMPEATQKLRQNKAHYFQETARNQQMARPDEQHGFDTQSTKLVFTYEKNGRPMEETFLVIWQIMIYASPQTGTLCFWSINDMRSVVGPAGSNYMNDPALITIAQSFKATPQWLNMMSQYYEARRPKKATRTSAPPPADTSGESVLDIMHKGWQKREAITAGSSTRNANMIHERTAYATPSGGTVNLSSHYNQVLTDGQDNYLLHNDANWNPNTDPNFNNQSWQTMTPQQ